MVAKKLALIAVVLGMMVFTACSSESADEYPDLGGAGLDEVMTLTVPDGFEASGENGGTFLPTGECVQKYWQSEDRTSEIGAEILVYDGEPIMVDPTTIAEFTEGEEVEIREYNGNTYHIVEGFSGEDGIEDSMLTAYVEYDKYIMCFEISSDEALTKEQKKAFNKMLKSVRFT